MSIPFNDQPLNLKGQTPQSAAVSKRTGSGVYQIKKLKEGEKPYYRILPFNADSMAAIGTNRPEFEVVMYYMKSYFDFKDEAQTDPAWIITCSGSELGDADRIDAYINMRLELMKAEGNTDALNKHNQLFASKYRRTGTVDDPLRPEEFKQIQKWIPLLSVEKEVSEEKNSEGIHYSKPTTGRGFIMNVGISGSRRIFTDKDSIANLEDCDEGVRLLDPNNGVDITAMKIVDNGQTKYSFTTRGVKHFFTAIQDAEIYKDENLPCALTAIEEQNNIQKFIDSYDAHIGYYVAPAEDESIAAKA